MEKRFKIDHINEQCGITRWDVLWDFEGGSEKEGLMLERVSTWAALPGTGKIITLWLD